MSEFIKCEKLSWEDRETVYYNGAINLAHVVEIVPCNLNSVGEGRPLFAVKFVLVGHTAETHWFFDKETDRDRAFKELTFHWKTIG